MMSGMRKAPPISINSPRETTVSRPCQGVEHEQHGSRVVVDDGGVFGRRSTRARDRVRCCRAPRVGRSRDRIRGRSPARIAVAAASTAASASTARPRLVCSTVPVRLNTARTLGRASSSRRPSASAAIASAAIPSPLPARAAARVRSSAPRMAATVADRPNRSTATAAAGVFSTSSTDGKRRNVSLSCVTARSSRSPDGAQRNPGTPHRLQDCSRISLRSIRATGMGL